MPQEKVTNNCRPKARIFLVEDHGIARLGLMQLINQQSDMVVCGEAESAAGALSGIPQHKPSLAVVDLTLKNDNGLELIKTVRSQDSSLPILVLSMHDEYLNAELALRASFENINSYFSESTVMQAMVGTDEYALHKAQVRFE